MKRSKGINSYSTEDLQAMVAQGEDRTDFARIDAMTAADVDQATAADPDWEGVPQDWYRNAEAIAPSGKVPVSIRLDADLVEFFREQGRGWQTRMNAVLRAYATAKRSAKAG
jgi:uncharacterized protein (DUF4415 family)